MRPYSYLIFFLLCSCNFNAKKQEEHRVVFYMDCGHTVFVLNDSLYNISPWGIGRMQYDSFRDSIHIADYTGMYYKKYLPVRQFVFDTVEVANHMIELRPYNIGRLYNVRIVGERWTVGLYHSFDTIKGTYEFEVSKSESEMLNAVLASFLQNVTDHYSVGDYSVNPTPAKVYLGIVSQGKRTEYYGESSSPFTEYGMLNQLMIVIIENHMRFHPRKLSKTTELRDVRVRYDRFLQLELKSYPLGMDLDSIIPPPPPAHLLKDNADNP